MTTFTTSSPCVYVSARSMLLMHVSRRRSVHCLLLNTVGERSNWIRVKLKNVHVLDKVLRNQVTKISYYNYFDQIELLKKTNIIIIIFFFQ